MRNAVLTSFSAPIMGINMYYTILGILISGYVAGLLGMYWVYRKEAREDTAATSSD